ncbi:MAG: hypothetical protein EXS64_13645 [Candidatus Latescibacteria bacterium]|nr:hypothetical protein [Candidatus Latescibacterota bacterium]
MIRFTVVLMMLVASASLVPRDAHALGVSIKLGPGFIPNGSIPGAMAAVELGPTSPFIEMFRKSGITTSNMGGNLILKLPLPVIKPYGGAGGGISRVSGGGIPSKVYRMLDLVAGADVNLPGTVALFGQVKYIYTFGSGALSGASRVRDIAFQAGLMVRLGK